VGSAAFPGRGLPGHLPLRILTLHYTETEKG
jgi:hypothetical protein